MRPYAVSSQATVEKIKARWRAEQRRQNCCGTMDISFYMMDICFYMNCSRCIEMKVKACRVVWWGYAGQLWWRDTCWEMVLLGKKWAQSAFHSCAAFEWLSNSKAGLGMGPNWGTSCQGFRVDYLTLLPDSGQIRHRLTFGWATWIDRAGSPLALLSLPDPLCTASFRIFSSLLNSAMRELLQRGRGMNRLSSWSAMCCRAVSSSWFSAGWASS